MKKLLLLLFIIMTTVSAGISDGLPIEKEIIKIVMVQSYGLDHVCGKPQRDGFYKVLRKNNRKYNFNMKTFYMKTKKVNITTEQKRKVSALICKEIHKFNPDVIVVFDDNAFLYVVVENIIKHYKKMDSIDRPKVYFSGLNRPYYSYIKEYPDLASLKISGVNEWTDLSLMFKMFNRIRYQPDNYYILADSSITSFYMSNNLIEELTKYNKPYSVISIENIHHLKKALLDLNKKPKGVILNTLQSLDNFEFGIRVVKEEITKEISNTNITHLVNGGNILYTRYGASFGISPDFQKMGELTGEIFINQLNNHSFIHEVKTPANLISVNKGSLEKISMQSLMLENLDIIKGELN